jgi:excisionase family DNA binding protein
VNNLLTPKEAAKLLRLSERTLRTLTAEGLIRRVQIGRSVRYDAADLATAVEAMKSKPKGEPS